MGEVKVVVHRGTHQIGGCCTEIRTDKTRILIDFGSNLPGSDSSVLLIPGVTSFGKRCDGIFITHNHGDHIGELDRVYADIPVFMGKKMILMQQEYRKHMKGHLEEQVHENEIQEIFAERKIEIGNMTVTPILSDHSAIQSFMFLIETEGKRILHTGDFRLHGPHREPLLDRLKMIGNLDLLITEGTTLSRDQAGSDMRWTEQMISEKCGELINRYKYCFMLTSTGNIDRIQSFANAIPAGKYFVADDYQKELLQIAFDDNLENAYGLKKILTYGTNIKKKMERQGFGMLVRVGKTDADIVRDFANRYPTDTCFIYSMWSGYDTKGSNIDKFCKIAGRHVYTLHVSGHVTKEDLDEMIQSIEPKAVIFIHTETGINDMRLKCRDKIVNISDKEAYTI